MLNTNFLRIKVCLGMIKLFGTPAEEVCIGKPHMGRGDFWRALPHGNLFGCGFAALWSMRFILFALRRTLGLMVFPQFWVGGTKRPSGEFKPVT